MALATICPHCNTTFRVASDQLKLRGGIVRCGACSEVFDGNAALIDLDAAAAPPAEADAASAPVPDTAAPEQLDSEAQREPELPAEPESEAAPEPSANAALDAEVSEIDAEQPEHDAEPVETLDFDTTFEPADADAAAQPEAGPEPEASSDPEPTVDEEIVALPPPDYGDEHLDDDTPDLPPAATRDEPDLLASLLMRESAAAEPAATAPPDAAVLTPKQARRNAKRNKPATRPVAVAEPVPEPAPSPEPVPEDDEPDFVRRIRLQEETGRTRRIAMGVATALLLIALAAQAMTTFRNVLAARYPDLKPVIAGTCAVFGCKVELPAQIDVLSVETGELQTLDATSFTYTTLLRNPGGLVQAWPHIELALTDANDKPVVRRVFTPAEYLPRGVAVAKGFGPHSEQAVKLSFELNQVKASGYHIAIFYP